MKERELFLAALDIEDPAARQAHLRLECGGNAELLARVESLLASHEGQSQFLNTPVVEQLVEVVDAGNAATIFTRNGSTQDDEPDGTAALDSHGPNVTAENRDDPADDIPLGYLQPSSQPGSIGRLGHYEIHAVLGRGAFGTVLKAFDEKLHRVVAIKVLAPEMAATSPARKRFLREAQASAAIRHEHVVSVYAVEESPIPHLVMEYIPGLTLQQRLDERGPLDVPTVLRLGRQIAEGLAAAHAQELIHRDIKPGNILLETSIHDRVKITDFGLARAADDASLTQSGTIAGTPMYMAPEQALGHKLDQRADLFSFGSVLYQMVSGRAPFRAPTTMAVLKRVTEDTPRPIREIIPETPQWLCDVIAKLHAKNPDERYQSAREVAEVLADCESQLKANARLLDFSRIPHGKPAARPRPGKRALVVGAVAMVLALIGIWAGPSAARYVSNQGVLEIQPGEGLVEVIVLHNDEGVLDDNKLKAPATDWLDMKQRQSLTLPPGRYQLNVGTWPAGTAVGQWEVTVSGLFGSNQVRIPVVQTSAIITVDRGQRVTLRPLMRPASTPVKVSQESPPGSEGWVQLFNGKDLSGWKNDDDHWTVENGMLVTRLPLGAVKTSGFLQTLRKDYRDFHIRTEAKINAGGDSGLFFRFGEQGDVSLQAQITTIPGSVGSLLRHAATVVPGSLQVLADTWFTLEVIARGPRVAVFVDGQEAAAWIDPMGGTQSGPIGFESGFPGTEFFVRKVEVKTFSASEVQAALAAGPIQRDAGRTPIQVAQNADGWMPLFNGKDLTGWKTTDELPGKWTVTDGILTGSSQQSYLFSERADFANFHLRVEAKTNGLGDSGVFFRAPFVLRHGAKAAFTQPASGYEVDLYNEPIPIGTITEIVKGAPPRTMCRAANNSAYRAGEWFTLELIADGNRFVTKVNGQETVNDQDASSRYSAGHLAISVFDPRTVVQFRKIEIRELPPPPASVPGPQPRFFASNEWIDAIPLIDPKLDKWDMRLTGKNEWRIEQGELIGGGADDKPHKLLIPLDADFFPSFECELEFTRRSGEQGFGFNLPNANGDTPLAIDGLGPRGVFVRHRRTGIIPLSNTPLVETGKRTNVRVEVRRQQVGDRITVWNGDNQLGAWTGDRNELVSINNEGYEHRRRLSLYINGGNEFVFHRIRVRMLDGGNAETLRPVAKSAAATTPPLAIAPFDAAQARAHQEAWAKHLGVPVETTTSIGMKLRLIPPGQRKLSPALRPGFSQSQPKPLYAGMHEVTVAQFRRFVKDTGYKTDAAEALNGGFHFAEPHGPPMHRAENLWSHADFAGAEDWPVSMVTWHDARAFCDWLSKKEGRRYRLPTESEWFWCAWAGSGELFHFGNDSAGLDEHAWHLENSEHKIHPVGRKKANPWGLLDVYGNLNEWCADWQREGRRVNAAEFPDGPGAGDSVPVRGLSFHDPGKTSPANPGQVPGTWASSHLGFRVILTDVDRREVPLPLTF